MKVRSGFVSNSSSSSFVVLLPENFLETVDYDKITNGDEDFPLESFKDLLNEVIANDGIWMEEIYKYDEDDYDFRDILDTLFDPYVIASFDTGPDEGQIAIANPKKVKEILGL